MKLIYANFWHGLGPIYGIYKQHDPMWETLLEELYTPIEDQCMLVRVERVKLPDTR